MVSANDSSTVVSPKPTVAAFVVADVVAASTVEIDWLEPIEVADRSYSNRPTKSRRNLPSKTMRAWWTGRAT